MTTMEDRQTVVRFFNDRFCVAFPDVDSRAEITDKEEIRARLTRFFAKPATTCDMYWIGERGFDDLSSFSVAKSGPYEFLGASGNSFFAFDITRVIPVCDGMDYRACVYIESRSCVDNPEVEGIGYGTESHMFHKSGRELSGSERNSGCFYVGPEFTEFTSDETVELFLSCRKSNILICPQFGAVLKANRDAEINEVLAGMLTGDKSTDDLKELVFSFPKPNFDFSLVTQRPLSAQTPDPGRLTEMLRLVQKSKSGK